MLLRASHRSALFPNIDFVFSIVMARLIANRLKANMSGGGILFIFSGLEDAIAALNHSGRTVIVISNRRGIALHRYSLGRRSQINMNSCRIIRHNIARTSTRLHLSALQGRMPLRQAEDRAFQTSFAKLPRNLRHKQHHDWRLTV